MLEREGRRYGSVFLGRKGNRVFYLWLVNAAIDEAPNFDGVLESLLRRVEDYER